MERFPADGRPDGLGLRPVGGEPPTGGSSVQGDGRVRPDTASRAAHGSGKSAALTIAALGLAVLPRRGKANPALALLVLWHPGAGVSAGRKDQPRRPQRPAAFQLAARRPSNRAAPGNLPGLRQRTSSKAYIPVYATHAPAASTARRPSVERLQFGI
jgi:hypothetical protein